MKKNAFTLIELMIVVAIIAFLSAISVPQYFKYQAKARQAEVSMNLASLHTAMQSYYAEHGRYTNVLWGENSVGWKPEGYQGGGKKENFYYTYGFHFPGAQEGVHYFTGKLETSKDELAETRADNDNFVIAAAGRIASKDKIDVWRIDENRKIEHIKDGIN